MTSVVEILRAIPPEQLRQSVRYIVVGLASTATYFSVFVTMIAVFGSAVWVAACAAFLTGVGISYLGNAIWTFNQRARSDSALRFLTVVAGSFLVNLAIAAALERLGMHYLIIFCVEAVALTTMNFAGHMLWTFRGHGATPAN